jgi:hypothetical protein
MRSGGECVFPGAGRRPEYKFFRQAIFIDRLKPAGHTERP